MSEKHPVGPEAASRETKDGACALCRGHRPASGRGRAVVLLVALAALGGVGCGGSRPDFAKLRERYEQSASAGTTDEAAAALGEIVDAGMRLYNERKFDEATTLFEWVVSKDPKRGVALNYLGVMARDRAEAEAKKANEALAIKSPGSPKVLPDYDDAIAWFTRAAEVDPLSPMHFYNLALIHLARKEFAAAEREIEKSMRLSPKAQYRLVWALCAQDGLQPLEVVKKRLRETIAAAEDQTLGAPAGELSPTGSLANAWTEAARRLAALGDNSGWDRLKKLAKDSPKKEVREFAEALLSKKPMTRSESSRSSTAP